MALDRSVEVQVQVQLHFAMAKTRTSRRSRRSSISSRISRSRKMKLLLAKFKVDFRLDLLRLRVTGISATPCSISQTIDRVDYWLHSLLCLPANINTLLAVERRSKVSLTVMAAERKALWQMSWHVEKVQNVRVCWRMRGFEGLNGGVKVCNF